jgi:PDZ domain-containing secreted protein
MKTYFNQKSSLFLLSVAFLVSSAWSPVAAQETETTTTIRTKTNESTELFNVLSSPKVSRNHSSSRSYTYTSNKPRLGVSLESGKEGAVVLKTFPKSAAENAGLKAGDKILSVNGTESKTVSDLQNIIKSHKIGDNITIKYEREGQTLTSTTRLKNDSKNYYSNYRTDFYYYNNKKAENFTENPCEKLDEIYGKPFLGVYLSNSYKENGTGALLTSVISKTGAFEANLLAEDKIVQMNTKLISSTDEAMAFIKSKTPGDKIRIRLIRNGEQIMIRATLGSFGDSPQVQGKIQQLEKYCDRGTPEEPNHPNASSREESNGTSPNAFEEETVIEVFPNPTSDIVNIKFEGKKAPLSIKVVDLNGKEMYSRIIQNFEGDYKNQLDLSTYPAGVYFIHLNQHDEQISKQVIVK